MRVVFMGSPDFALPTLHALLDHFDLVGVVTQPDRPAGRGRQLRPPPVKLVAQEHSIPIHQPNSLKGDALAPLRSWAPDVIVVAAYGLILPAALLDLPPAGCLNVHASLLPRWRGAAPVQAAILHGDEETGVTIMKMDRGLDTGPILAQRRTPIGLQETGGELTARLAAIGAELLVETLPPYMAGELVPSPQEEEGATRAPLLHKSDGRLDFRESAERLARQVRAYEPWPKSFLRWRDRRITVRDAAPAESRQQAPPGLATAISGEPAVHTREGLLVLKEVQPAGKRRMAGASFLNGAQDFPGSQLPLPK